MRARGATAAAIAFVILVMPIAASAGTVRPALFSDAAGFAQGRTDHQTIGVERDRWLAPAIKYWNDRAGWKLLAFSDEPLITTNYNNKCAYCASPYAASGQIDLKSAYVRCEISINASDHDDLPTVAHEIGHCLGLRHQHKGVMSMSMSEKILRGWRPFDRGLVIEAGYAD